MKVWYQSATAIGVDPLWHDYEQALIKHVNAIKRPDIEIHVKGVQTMFPKMGSYRYFSLLNSLQVIHNALRAQQEGYDAVFNGCMNDPGYYEIREIVDIPVCFASEAAMHLASMLAPRFAFLCYSETSMRKRVRYARELGFGDRLVPSASIGITLADVRNGFKKPDPIVEACEEIARRAAHDGAGVLVPGCGSLNMVLVNGGVQELAGLPVLDVVAAVVKTGEMILDLSKMGINRSRRGDFSQPTRDELTTALRVYQVAL